MLFPRWSSTVWLLVTNFVLLSYAHASGGVAEIVAELPHNPYSIRIWQTEDGLAQNSVTAITQTRDGYIWVGTYGGLSRFDGERFQNFDAVNTPALEDSSIVSLHEDPEGTLWIGHDSGHLTRYHKGRFESVKMQSSHVHQKITAMVSDRNGALWLLRQTGALESVKDGRTLGEPRLTHPPNLLGLVRNEAGMTWMYDNGTVSELVDGKLVPVNFGPGHIGEYVGAMGVARDGALWIVRDGLIRKWVDGRWKENRGPYPWGEIPISSLIELHDKTLAVGTMDQGFYLLYPNGKIRHFDQSNGLPQNWIRFLYEDRENNLWVGAGTSGLLAVRPTAFSVLNAPDQWQGRTVLSVTADRDGALWIGTEGAGLYRYQNGWTHYDEEQGLGKLFVWSVAEAPDGKIWAGTWGGGTFRLEDGRFHRVEEMDTGIAPVLALHFGAGDTGLWAGTGLGLLRWQNKKATWAYRPETGARANVSSVLQDRDGSVWFSIAGGGLGRLAANGKLTQFRKTDGLSSNSVQCLMIDDGVIWIGTADGGLNRFKDGRFSIIGVNQGLANNVICHISDDGLGYLWLSTHRGILRLAKNELNRCADGLSATVVGQVYDRSDGLPTLEYSGGLQAAGCQTPDGRLWFPSGKGLVSVDPSSIRLNPTPPPLALETLRVDGRVIDTSAGADADIRLGPDHERLEFQYTALSLSAPNKVLFKYRLEGLDKDWVDAGTKRTAFYSHLPAGKYRFQFIACNNDGLWNLESISLAFTVLPFFWQTWWFVGLAGLGILSAVAIVVRYQTRHRMQRRVAQLERQHAIERERARIAQDIHDDIGASLTRITMLSQSVQSELSQSKQAASVLDRIGSTAREVTRALDEIVWAVDPRHDTLDSLVCYMGKFAQDFLAAADVRCRLDLPVNLPAWPLTAETRHNLFLAFKEALNNTLKHAGATEVRVSLKFQPHAFILSVKDNGCGFDLSPEARSESSRGNGLVNLQRRLARIGGRCEIKSSAQEGTCVSFVLGVAESDLSANSGDSDSSPPSASSAPQSNKSSAPPLSLR